MKEYHKIQTVFRRDMSTNFKTLLEGEYSLPELKYLKDCLWVFTEKVDGTNIRVMLDGDKITFGGKTEDAQIPQFLVNRLNDLFLPIQAREKLRGVFSDAKQVCLYGEGYGAKIQKGGGNYIKHGQDFCLFDVWVDGLWLKREDIEDVANKLSFGFTVAPIIGTGTLDTMVEMAREGFDSLWGPFTAEGIVARPEVELITRRGERVITKIKHKDFLFERMKERMG
ncbi:RNA ligase [Caudoviricetes sp.]|nr:RNA ligase [Caudoviricetes sp.]UOF80978.1 RNA ligase [Caudoviricetes sp.]UOF81367.1 RNA ligase [Caudoviricetes sp.]